jgi:protein SCO1/2
MADLAAAMTRLPGSLASKVWVQFVSTDPHRDTAARLSRWIDYYSATFHAGRAPIEQVVAAARSYAIAITPPKVTKHDYEVTHGAQVLVLDQHGGEVGFFSELAGAKAYAEALPTLIKDYA